MEKPYSYEEIVQNINSYDDSEKEVEEIIRELEESIKIMSIDDVYKIFRDIKYPISHKIIAAIDKH